MMIPEYSELNAEELEAVSGGARTVVECFPYTVQKGDTIEKLAKKYGTTAEMIISVNHLKDNPNLVPGMTIRIPKKK